MKCFEWELERIDWTVLRASAGRTAASIPDALRSLAAAEDDQEAEERYWTLDNVVVVQGSAFEAAEYIIPPALQLLSSTASDVVRRWVLELLIQVSTGWIDGSERALGNEGLGERCRARAREGLALVYALLDAQSGDVRDRAVDLLESIDPDKGRLAWILTRVAETDPEPAVRELADRLAKRLAG